jgi:MFS family permease
VHALRITERIREFLGLRGNILPIATLELVSNVGWNMFGVAWQPFVLSLGATVSILGALEGFGTALRSVLQLLMGRLSDSVGRRKPIFFSYAFTLIGLVIMILSRSWVLLVPALVVWAFADSIWDPVFPAIISESVGEEERGTAFSVWSLTWFLPGFFAPALGGYIAGSYGYNSIMVIMFSGESIAFVIFALYVKETLKTTGELQLGGLLGSLKRALRPPSGLSGFYACTILSHFAWLMGEGLLYAMLLESFGFSLFQLGILANALSLSVVLTQIPFGKLVDRYGSKPFLIASQVLWSLIFIGYLLSRNFTSFLAVRLFRGLVVSTWEPAYYSYISNAVPGAERARSFGDLNCLRGLICFPAPILGAFLFENFGLHGPILGGLALTVLVTIALTTLQEK